MLLQDEAVSGARTAGLVDLGREDTEATHLPSNNRAPENQDFPKRVAITQHEQDIHASLAG